MTHLRLAGVSEDGKRLRMVSDSGEEFTLDADDRLRSALTGGSSSAARLGQWEIRMESTIRPRDIQARIRAGESPESVAEAARTTVEKIMPFAGPVLAERQHVAERAQRSSVRRRSDGSGSARTLGDAVTAQLRPLNVKAETVEWDAWRREDGRWTLAALYESDQRTGVAHFTFDAPGNYVVLDDDDARWLVGDLVEPEPAPAEPDDLERARMRRQAAPSPDQLPLGDDAIDLVSGDQPLEAFLDPAPGADETEVAEEAADAAALDDDPEPAEPAEPVEPAAETATDAPEADPAADEPPARRPVRKTRGRASVPSWDEIMFGGGKQD